jgi:hypothetical protein
MMSATSITRRLGGVRRVPLGLLGMLLLVAGIEPRLGRISREYADIVVRDWQKTRQESNRDLRGFHVLCFGDSQVKTGVAPQVIEARTGLRAYNFALIGGQAPSSYFMLRRALKRGARPEAVVVDFLPPLLGLGLERNHRNLPELIGLPEAIELAWSTRDPGAFLALATAIVLPSIRARHDLREGVVAALHGRSASRRNESFYKRNRRQNLGALLLEPKALAEDPGLWYRTNYPAPWTCRAVHASYLDRFLALAAANRITVYWLLPPLAPAAQAFCEERGQDARYEQFVRRTLERHGNLVVVDGRHAGYREPQFIDTVHMNAQAAAAQSAGLAAILRSSLPSIGAGGRWKVLPEYRDGAGAHRLETLADSARALDGRIARR